MFHNHGETNLHGFQAGVDLQNIDTACNNVYIVLGDLIHGQAKNVGVD